MTLAKYNAMPPLAGNETPLARDDTDAKIISQMRRPPTEWGSADVAEYTHAISEERKRLARIATEYEAE